MRATCLAAIAAVLIVAPVTAQAAATCSAAISDVVFGEVYVRDALAPQTIGNLDIACQSGTPNAEVRACLYLGAGSGGATANARYMDGHNGQTLAYQLSAYGHGGAAWDTVEFAVPLDALGNGSTSAAIYAEVLSSGVDVAGGSYSSTFSGADVTLTYGDASCQGGGSATPGSFAVTATVTPSCTVSVGALDFGDVSENLVSGASGSASIDVTCTDGAPYSITLGTGLGAGVSDPQERRMASGSDSLVYGIYQDPAGSQQWGWSLAQDDVAATGDSFVQRFIAYGIIHAGQAPNPGWYSDSVVVTVHY